RAGCGRTRGEDPEAGGARREGCGPVAWPRMRIAAALVLLAAVLAGCGGGAREPAATSARDAWGTTWLCRPGLAGDPCLSDLTTTAISRSGALRVERASAARAPAVDCFYVYPTISEQPTVNANLAIDFRETEVAVAQASRFSQACRVYAPVYRQIT